MSKAKQAQASKQSKITANLMRKKFIYDPETGHFYKKERVDRHDGCRGYRKIQVTIDGKRYWIKAHRAAFLMMTGQWPENHIDHIDLDKGNNKWDNLRSATHAQNLSNMAMFKSNKSGYKGVFYRKDLRAWTSSIGHNNKRIYLGQFKTAEEAYAAYCAKSDELHKEFSRKT
jgi:hypothetical protein